MPTFPTYDGELPQCLNPLNPRHYGLVLYWIFFRPTALKCYLYQANPKIYKSEGSWQNFITGIQSPAYHNLILIVFLSVFIICIPIVYLPYFLNASTGCIGISKSSAEYKICDSLSTSLHAHNWLAVIGWAAKKFLAIAGLTLQGVAGGVAYGVAIDVAIGVAIIVAHYGVAIGVAVSVAYGVAAIGVIFGVVFGMTAIGVAYGVAIDVAYGVAIDVAFGVAFGVAVSVGAIRLPFYI